MAVIFAAAAGAPAQIAQTGPAVRRPQPSAGPRAIGVVQLAANGKASLVPVAILYGGKFYDAGSFKASPIPMALEPGVVYEATKTGVSQGLFTVTGVRVGDNHVYYADGNWLPAGAVAAAKGHQAETKPKMENFDEGPPKLRKAATASAAASSGAEPAPAQSSDAKPVAGETKTSGSDTSSTSGGAKSGSGNPESPPAASSASSSAAANPPPMPGEREHVVLRRGAPRPEDEATVPQAAQHSTASAKNSKSASASRPAKAVVQLIPAVSDAKGPDPRPYAFQADAQEEQEFRSKMLALATNEVRAKAREFGDLTGDSSVSPSPAKRRATTHAAKKPAAPKADTTFDDVQLRIFDLSSTNEPVAVLTATAHLPAKPDVPYFVTLVARQDIYAELHKAFSNVTDSRHLDVIPRVELVDAIDADGDGRGELLFRRLYDQGSAYIIYRQIGDQLWPLFEGTPQ
jgi:hypothetical protein